ncbi:MAG: PEP-CTERM sorting domain-containing protein [Phycisphaerae bacterium]|nr:PEP-CTERM sorting domain-containing protein [Phycisphaerae bacterium]
MKTLILGVAALPIAALIFLSSAPATAFGAIAPSFHFIGSSWRGYPPYIEPACEIADISADGSVATGYQWGTPGFGFRWTLAAGLAELGELTGKVGFYLPRAMSADGSVIAGTRLTCIDMEGWIWTQQTGMQPLTQTMGLTDVSFAIHHISADATVLLGHKVPDGDSALFRWSEDTGFVTLGTLAGGNAVWGGRVSGDGSVVVGTCAFRSGPGEQLLRSEAVRWLEDGTPVSLGILPGFDCSLSRGVSADGSVIVGTCRTIADNPNDMLMNAFRWTPQGGMTLLDIPAQQSSTVGVSGDGQTIVGWWSEGGPYIWNAADGFRSIEDVLVNDCGLDLAGWEIQKVYGISDDGSTVFGQAKRHVEPEWGARNYTEYQSYVATIPEPATVALLGFGSLLLIRRRRR